MGCFFKVTYITTRYTKKNLKQEIYNNAQKDTVQFSYIIGFNMNFRTFHHFTSSKILNQSLDFKISFYV